MDRIIILARVSTSKQENFRQLSELKEVCLRNNYNIVATFSETISGKYGIADRTVLQQIIRMAELKQFDKLVVSEISRIGRRTSEVLKFIEILTEHKISIYIHNYGLETLDRELNQNPLMGMLISFLSSFSDLERNLTIGRVKSGIEEARKNGVVLGRPTGKTKPIEAFIKENRSIVSLIEKGLTIRQIVKITGKSSTTICKANKILKGHLDNFKQVA